jgi:hypothetical protein
MKYKGLHFKLGAIFTDEETNRAVIFIRLFRGDKKKRIFRFLKKLDSKRLEAKIKVHSKNSWEKKIYKSKCIISKG